MSCILPTMTGDASDNKAILRRDMRQHLRAMDPQEQERASAKIREQLESLSLTTCAIFAGTETEPDLLPLLKTMPHIRWLLPRVIGPGVMEFCEARDASELKPGAFGILEPTSPPHQIDQIATIICPGLAFSPDGKRLGQGGGFYDRLLAQHTITTVIGACFQCQLRPDLPTDAHDQLMHHIISA